LISTLYTQIFPGYDNVVRRPALGRLLGALIYTAERTALRILGLLHLLLKKTWRACETGQVFYRASQGDDQHDLSLSLILKHDGQVDVVSAWQFQRRPRPSTVGCLEETSLKRTTGQLAPLLFRAHSVAGVSPPHISCDKINNSKRCDQNQLTWVFS